jgi:hypothetical protein
MSLRHKEPLEYPLDVSAMLDNAGFDHCRHSRTDATGKHDVFRKDTGEWVAELTTFEVEAWLLMEAIFGRLDRGESNAGP